MKRFLLGLLVLALSGCVKDMDSVLPHRVSLQAPWTLIGDSVNTVLLSLPRLVQVDSLGWIGPDSTYADNRTPDFSVETPEPIRLNFFGWSAEDDYRFHLQFPENTDLFGLAQLSYTMCAWGDGPADWDMTTQIMVRNK